MNLTTPAALWLLLLLPVIVLAYLMKKSVRNKTVPNLFLWDEVFEKRHSSLWNFRVRSILSLLAAVVIAILLITAITKPEVKHASHESVAIIIIDNSASMSVIENRGLSRWNTAVDILKSIVSNKEVNQQMMIMTSAGTPEIVCGFTDNSSTLRESISLLKLTDRVSFMKEAIDMAASLSITGTRNADVYVITDGCFENSERMINQKTAEHLKWFIVGSPKDNKGITQFQTRRNHNGTNVYDTLIKVANYSKQKFQGEIEIDLNDAVVDIIPITLESGQIFEETKKYSSNTGGIVHLTLLGTENISDSLKMDNEAWSILPDLQKLNIMYYGEKNIFLQNVLQAQNNVQLEYVTEPPGKLPLNTILVVHRSIPGNLPKGKIVIVNPQNNGEFFKIGKSIDTSPVEVENEQSPLLRSVRWNTVKFSGGRLLNIADNVDVKVFVNSPDVPLLFSIQNFDKNNSEQLVLNFSCSEENLYLKTVFPIIFSNICSFFRGRSGDDSCTYSMNDRMMPTVALKEKPVKYLDSKGMELNISVDDDNVTIPMPTTVGITSFINNDGQIVHQNAVNLCSDTESHLKYDSEMKSNTYALLAMTVQKPIWLLCAIAALLFLVAEWVLYHRRQVE